MSTDQILLSVLLAITVALFISEKWRYDLVAMFALFAAVVLGLVPSSEAFSGFSNPVVVTVACVLILSAAVSRSGIIDYVLRFMSRFAEHPNLQIVTLCTMVMFFSAFMNNVGAVALFLPIAIAVARASNRAPSELLMPLAFSSLIGGLVTLIGTPPNLLISGIRENLLGKPYALFDFAPVGLALCLGGLAYLTVGWRLLPADRRGKPLPENQFAIEDYLAELKVVEGASVIGSNIRDIENLLQTNFSIIGLIRGEVREAAPSARRVVREGDILIVRSDPQTIKTVVDKTKMQLIGNKDDIDIPLTSEGVGVIEAVVRAESRLIGFTPRQIRLRSRYGVNLLALRQTSSHRAVNRLREVVFHEGDIIILQGDSETMSETLEQLGCLPLAQRNLQLGQRGFVFLPALIMLAALGATIAGLLPIGISFLGGVVALGVFRIMRLHEMYAAIDWPVIILLGALIPVTGAMESTGMTELASNYLAGIGGHLPGAALLTLVLVATLAITPFLNNAATVLLMGPIAAGLAVKAGFAVDPFLMAVALGASCDFLTPVGHQANTLVMGPGGYKFTDYARLGFPLTIMVVLIGVPMLMLIWPL